jgi:hypothetical protein
LERGAALICKAGAELSTMSAKQPLPRFVIVGTGLDDDEALGVVGQYLDAGVESIQEFRVLSIALHAYYGQKLKHVVIKWNGAMEGGD